MASCHRRVAAWFLPRRSTVAAADGAHALRPYRLRLVGRGRARQPRPGQLRRGEVGAARRGEIARARDGVAPGVIAGALSDAAFDAEQIRSLVPAGRAGTAQEVAALIAFLCSDAAAY